MLDYEEFKKLMARPNSGYVKMMWCGCKECEEQIKKDTTATSRCIPFHQENLGETCPVCGKKAKKLVYWAKAYQEFGIFQPLYIYRGEIKNGENMFIRYTDYDLMVKEFYEGVEDYKNQKSQLKKTPGNRRFLLVLLLKIYNTFSFAGLQNGDVVYMLNFNI